jgi:hypothetical protein
MENGHDQIYLENNFPNVTGSKLHNKDSVPKKVDMAIVCRKI